jgi:hypothetical protein
MSYVEELIVSIETRIGEARSEIGSLETARAELVSTEAVTAKPRRRASRRRVAAGPAQVAREALETVLATSDGLTTSDVVSRTGATRIRVLSALRELERAGRIRRSGIRRGTRWHAISDEERVGARAAELRRQSRARRGASRPAPR